MNRKVEWFEYEHKIEDNKSFYDKVLKGKAKFLAFGVDYEEINMGVGNFSTAIIELSDGTVKNIPVENIKFIK
jgi:hypothetical protein